MNRYIKELLYFVVAVVLSVSIYFAIFGGFTEYVQIQVRPETYDALIPDEVFSSVWLIFQGTVAFLFVIYFIRAIALKSKDTVVNLIYLISTTALILIVSYLIGLNEKHSIEGGWTIYPPLSALPQQQKVEEYNFICNSAYLYILQVMLLVSVLYSCNQIKTNKQ